MRFPSLFLFLLLPATISAEGNVTNASNATGCLTSVDPNKDYFPTKVSPTDSQFWSIEYFNTYKVLTNKDAGTTYALYQCGSQPPTDQTYTEIIEIPLTSVGVMSTPILAMLEQVGQLDTVKYYLTDTQYISSPCFLDQITQGLVVVPTNPDPVLGTIDLATPTTALNDTVAFGDAYSPPYYFQQVVIVSEYMEKTNAAIFEWVKFFAAFYNAEELASAVVQSASNQWDCISTQATATTTDSSKPKVLWAYYSYYCDAWGVGSCPNYYCEFAAACGAEMILATHNGTSESLDCPGVPVYTTDELVELGKDADYFFYLSEDWNETYSMFQSQLDTMKSVQEKRVFDYQGSGKNVWFEQRYAEYYDVLQDYCRVVGTYQYATSAVVRGERWFRNVFNESVGNLGTCDDSLENQLPFVFESCQPSGGETSGGETSGGDEKASWASYPGGTVLPLVVVWGIFTLFLQ